MVMTLKAIWKGNVKVREVIWDARDFQNKNKELKL